MSSQEAREEIESMLSSNIFVVLPVTELILRKAIILSSERGIRGIKIWDAVIVATMLENGLSILYTENLKDFEKFRDVIVVEDLQKIK